MQVLTWQNSFITIKYLLFFLFVNDPLMLEKIFSEIVKSTLHSKIGVCYSIRNCKADNCLSSFTISVMNIYCRLFSSCKDCTPLTTSYCKVICWGDGTICFKITEAVSLLKNKQSYRCLQVIRYQQDKFESLRSSIFKNN